MRIGINAEKTNDGATGVGNYSTNLVRAMLKLAPHASNELFLYFFHRGFPGENSFLKDSTHARIRSSETPYRHNSRRILWEQFHLPLLAKGDSLDLLHYVDHSLSLIERPCPTVITVHDLAFYRMPKMYDFTRRYYKQLIARPSIKKATRIIAISEHTKNEIVELIRVNPDKIDVIPYGLNPVFRQIENKDILESFCKKHRLPKNFILFVGTFQPRKNLDALLTAFSRIPASLRPPMVFCGQKGWLYKPIFSRIGQLNLQKEIIVLGPLPNETLPLLYNSASLFVYPSLYEGFGLPLLEAMACGVPVLASNGTSIPEVVGDAAETVNPKDIDAISNSLERLFSDDEKRNRLIKSGLKRASIFSWEKTARLTYQTYDKAIQAV